MFGEPMHSLVRNLFEQTAQFILAELASGNAVAGLSAIYEYASAFTESNAHRLQMGSNVRYLAAKEFSFVLPTQQIVNWLCDQFQNVDRVISIGAGSCLVETAMHLEFQARGRQVKVICVDSGVETLGPVDDSHITKKGEKHGKYFYDYAADGNGPVTSGTELEDDAVANGTSADMGGSAQFSHTFAVRPMEVHR